MDKKLRVGWMFLVLGPVMLAGAGYAASRTAAFLETAVSADGTVVRVIETDHAGMRGRRKHAYYPVVEFATASGEARTFIASIGSASPKYAVGERVTVLYDPEEPDDVRFGDTYSIWGLSIVLGGMGVVFAAVGGGIVWRKRRDADGSSPRHT